MCMIANSPSFDGGEFLQTVTGSFERLEISRVALHEEVKYRVIKKEPNPSFSSLFTSESFAASSQVKSLHFLCCVFNHSKDGKGSRDA